MTDSPRLTDAPPNRALDRDSATTESVAPREPEIAASAADANTPGRPARITRRAPTIGLNWRVVALVAVIIGGAFALSADSWINLAEIAGFTTDFALPGSSQRLYLSWALPIVVDAYTTLTTWLYLFARPDSQLRTYARYSAFTGAGLSVAAQGAYHGLSAAEIDVAKVWPLVVAVGAIPPVLLGSAVHLLTIYLHEHRPAPAVPKLAPPRVAPARVTPTRRAPQPPQAVTPPAASPTPQRLAVVAADAAPESVAPAARQISDDDMRAAIHSYVVAERRAGREPAQRTMQRIVLDSTGARVGQRRCIRIAATITDDDSADEPDRELAGASA